MPTTPSPIPAHLILASQSPRRALILREAHIPFTVRVPDFDDPATPIATDQHPTPEQLACALAQQKAASVASIISTTETHQLILAADTICVDHQNQLIGKPESPEAARQMITQFVNQTHAVITGVCLHLLSANPSDEPTVTTTITTFADTAHVTLGPLNANELENYIATNDWQGKAGGYNLTDRQAVGWPLDVQGDPNTVVGLPLAMIQSKLDMLGIQLV